MGTTAFAVVDFDASGVAAGVGAVAAGVAAVVAAVGAVVAGVGGVAAGCCARAAPVPRKPANASAREVLKKVRFISMSFGGNPGIQSEHGAARFM
jgi:hypothetical protein